MTCADVLAQVEPIAAGDATPTAELRAHLETCPLCAGALAKARSIEAMLAARPVIEAPPRFIHLVQQRIRRERWLVEQRVDRVFNLAIAAAVLLFAAGVFFLLRGPVLLDATSQVLALLTSFGTDAVQTAAPSMATYVAATGLFVSGLAMWWWAES